MLTTAQIATPLGPVVAVAHEARLCGIEFADRPSRVESMYERFAERLGTRDTRRSRDVVGLRAALEAYFDGDLAAIDAVPFVTCGTPFEERVWTVLRTIRAGTTLTYGELAARVGQPSAARSAGSANGRNVLTLVVPCHRVVAAHGGLGGYGSGLERKRWLLAHEARHAGAAVLELAAR